MERNEYDAIVIGSGITGGWAAKELNERSFGMWTNEKESSYAEQKRFDWFRGYYVGGALCCGGINVIAGIRKTLWPMLKTGLRLIGLFVMKI